MDQISSTRKHALLVYFPGSGRVGDLERNVGAIVRRLVEEGGYHVSATVLNDSQTLKSCVEETHADIIVACGGDGTVRRVLEAVALSKMEVPVGIVPLGTANLLAKSLGVVASGYGDHIRDAIDIILNGRTARIDLGVANDRVFAIDVGVGPVATAVIAPSSTQKRLWKMFAYAKPFFQAMNKAPVRFEVEIDGQPQLIQAHGIFVTNEREMGMTTDAGDLSSLRDGRLEFYVLSPQNLFDWLQLGWAIAVAYFRNASLQRPPYRKRFARRNIRINSDQISGYMLDGDRCSSTPIDIKILPAAVTVFVPQWARKQPIYASQQETASRR